MTRINPHHAPQLRPETHRVLGVERAAAVCGVSPATLLGWTERGQGPAPYLIEDDGTAVAWSSYGLYLWREDRKAGFAQRTRQPRAA